ncbi:MAG TPA: uracil-DNA glycosylase [Casimicrobiaceae bacterium]|nr:uracil-DNA glycosylase [Casimicrobiaceae bacterium]
MLRELGLSPTWRMRPAFRPGKRGPDAADATQDELPATAADPRRLRIATLDMPALVADIAQCTACALCRTRRNTVPGVGDVHAQWMFVGEAPGADEDAQGEPFVGMAGQLLDNMLAALGLDRAENVYIANVLKCRPPNNRDPEPLEAEACGAYLDRQIELVAPRLIVALGRSAACRLLGMDAPVGGLRNRVHRYRGTPLVVTYHPAYLLRTPADKAKVWEDLLFARSVLRGALEAANVRAS